MKGETSERTCDEEGNHDLLAVEESVGGSAAGANSIDVQRNEEDKEEQTELQRESSAFDESNDNNDDTISQHSRDHHVNNVHEEANREIEAYENEYRKNGKKRGKFNFHELQISDDHDQDEECNDVISLAEEQPPCSYYEDQKQILDQPENDSEQHSHSPQLNSSQQQQFFPPSSQQPQNNMMMNHLMNFPQASMYGGTGHNYVQQNHFSFPHPPLQPQQPPQQHPFLNNINPMFPSTNFFPPSNHELPPSSPFTSPPPQLPLPIQLSIPMSSTFANNAPSNDIDTLSKTQQLHTTPPIPGSTSLFQEVQYYESKMRDHAAAYASAAAGAAWAAAQIASGSTPSTPMTMQQQHHQQLQHKHQSKQRHKHQNALGSGNAAKKKKMTRKQKRSNHAFQEVNHSGTKSFGVPTTTTITHKGNQQQQQSSSSFGNYIQYQQNKRSRSRREFNPYNSQNLHHQQSQHQFFKKKRTLGLQSLCGKNAVSALFELCSKRNWPAPKFVSLSSTNQSVSTPSQTKKKNDIKSDKFCEIDNLKKAGKLMTSSMDLKTSEETAHNTAKASGTGYISSSTLTTTASASTNCCTDFLITVQVNGQDLGKGRGGSKKSAQQDAARKALIVLYPGAVFDANGVLLDLGNHDDDENDGNTVKNKKQEDNYGIDGAVGLDLEYCNLNIGSRDCSRDQEKRTKTVVEDLETNLASRLAIDGEENGEGTDDDVQEERHGRESPTPSEDSSISTTVSMAKNIVTPLMTGGPFKRNGSVGSGSKGKIRSSIYPCASGTSVSSATSDDDDDEYFASRGAHVCSVLLHAMAQIDERILEPPSYTYDVCPRTTTSSNPERPNSSSKRKGSGGVAAVASKRLSTTNEAGRTITIHRCSFSCTASLILYKNLKTAEENRSKSEECSDQEKEDKNKGKCTDENEGKGLAIKKEVLEKDNKHESLEKINDKVQKKSLANPNSGNSEEKSDDKDNQKNDLKEKTAKKLNTKEKELVTSKVVPKIKITNRKENIEETKKLEAVATGASKRDAKHIASAKLLALLFPDCEGMAAVVKAAEAAREKYAAKKALKQSMKATNYANTKRKKMKCSENLSKCGDKSFKNKEDDDIETLHLNRDNYNISKSHLQSVKEEEYEENEGKESIRSADQFCHKRLKLK